MKTAEEYAFFKHPLQYHDGSWQVINLIYANGELAYRHEGAFGFGDLPPAKTEVLDRCPYFDEVLASLPGKVKMARLSALPTNGRILRHYDPIESIDFNNVRIHIPIRTSRKVIFYLGYRRRRWEEGEVWYGDFTFPHSVYNRSPLTRVHIIVDLELNDHLKEWFPRDYLSTAALARRAKLRRMQKDLSWYHKRLEGLIGVTSRPATN
ncbi:MAG: aspartyl/asparaginyl beta-hydroxylase domain-containing protein [Gammaproteobacteria bacterium]